MAALGWLLNLDFAASGLVAATGSGEQYNELVFQRRPYRYRYGYRYIAPLVGWLLW